MKEKLLNIIKDENGNRLVSAKEIYSKLELNSKSWRHWANRNIVNNLCFEKDVDYIEVEEIIKLKAVTDYAVSVTMAKELILISHAPKSHIYRKYLIECEEELKKIKEEESLLIRNPDTDTKQWYNDIIGGGKKGLIGAKQIAEIYAKPFKEKVKEQIVEIEEKSQTIEHQEVVIQELSERVQVIRKNTEEYINLKIVNRLIRSFTGVYKLTNFQQSYKRYYDLLSGYGVCLFDRRNRWVGENPTKKAKPTLISLLSPHELYVLKGIIINDLRARKYNFTEIEREFTTLILYSRQATGNKEALDEVRRMEEVMARERIESKKLKENLTCRF